MRGLIAAAALMVSSPALADPVVCFVQADSLPKWSASTGQTPLFTMDILIGPGITTPGVIYQSPDGAAWALFFKREDRVCIMALGTNLQPATR